MTPPPGLVGKAEVVARIRDLAAQVEELPVVSATSSGVVARRARLSALEQARDQVRLMPSHLLDAWFDREIRVLRTLEEGSL